MNKTAATPVEISLGLRERITPLIPLMQERADEADRLGHLTPDVIDGLTRAGAFSAWVPAKFGGDDASHIDLYDLLLEVAKGSAAAGWITLIAGANLDFALSFPDEALAGLIDPAWPGPLFAGAVFNAKHVTGVGRSVSGGVMLKGSWQFCSGLHHTKSVICGFRCEGDPTLYCAFVEPSGGEVVDDWQVVGLRASSSNSFRIEKEAFVPQHRITTLSTVLANIPRLEARHGKKKTRPSNAIAVGTAYGGLDIFIAQAKGRKASGFPGDRMADVEIVQSAVGQAWADISAAEAVGRLEAGLMGDPVDPSAIMFAYRSQYAARRCADAIDKLHHLMGSSAIYDSNPLQRSARDLRALCLHPMFRSDLAIYNIGRMLCGHPPTELFDAK